MPATQIATNTLNSISKAVTSVSSNLANSNSIGGKEDTALFASLVVGNNDGFSGGGATVTNTQNITTQGNLQTSNISTHMSISGSGFFVCSNTKTGPDIAFTRAGHFIPDKDGNLCNANGFYLMGWKTVNGVIPDTTNTNDLASLTRLNIYQVDGLSKETTNLKLGYNLPADDTIGTTHTSTASIYDSLGVKHNINITWTRANITPAQWDLAITCANGTVTQGNTPGNPAYGAPTPVRVTFDADGKPISYGGSVTPPNISITWDPAVTNADVSDIAFDLGTINTLTGVACRAGEFATIVQSQDGREISRQGTANAINIDDEGKVSAVYVNGQSVTIGYVALANFQSSNKLEAISGNAYLADDQAGDCALSKAKTGSFGKIVAGALEASTINMSENLTTLITLQNAYTANTKSIATERKQFEELFRVVT